jgi:hypothetical protein
MAKKARKRKASTRAPRAVARGKRGTPLHAGLSMPLPPRAQFVFRGVVLQTAAATFAEVPVNARTVVVRVDEILEAPDLLQDYVGQPITVQLGTRQKAAEGKEYVFRTDSYIFGAGLAVTAESVTPAATGNAAQRMRAAASTAVADRVKARAERAEMVVTGKVTEVRQVPPPPGAPISEHDPEWQEAVVEVEQVVRGPARRAATTKQVVIRFSNSRDVKWARAPKFRVGREGVWMLGEKSSDKSAAHNQLRAAAAVPTNQYLVLDPEDFHPKEEATQILSDIA